MSLRSHGLSIALGLALGCASPSTLVLPELPAFTPYDEHIAQANRTVRIVAEWGGALDSGDRLYYVSYITEEAIEIPSPFGYRDMGDPLYGELWALGLQRQKHVDPAIYRFLVIDGRRHPGTQTDPARRIVFESENGKWSRRFAHFVLEH